MYASEILRVIIESDLEAQAIYNSALNEQDGFDTKISEHKKELRDKYFGQAEDAIAEHEKREALAAGLAIAEMDRRLADELDTAQQHFESIKQIVAGRIFDAVVEIDA